MQEAQTTFQVGTSYGGWSTGCTIDITERTGNLVSGWLISDGYTVRFTDAKVYLVGKNGEHEALHRDTSGALDSSVQFVSNMTWMKRA